jgi:hypothetical protein
MALPVCLSLKQVREKAVVSKSGVAFIVDYYSTLTVNYLA